MFLACSGTPMAVTASSATRSVASIALSTSGSSSRSNTRCWREERPFAKRAGEEGNMACDDMAGDEEEKLEGESTVQRMDLTFYGVGQRCLNSWLAVFHKSCGNVGETRQPRPGSGTASGR